MGGCNDEPAKVLKADAYRLTGELPALKQHMLLKTHSSQVLSQNINVY